MHPTEDEQIVNENLMLIQSGAKALVAARRAVARYYRTSNPASGSDGGTAAQQIDVERSRQLRQQVEANRARAEQNKDMSQHHQKEALIARWAAAEAAREHAVHIADAWATRLHEAGIDPNEITTAAEALEETAAARPEPAATETAAEHTRDVVVEQLAEQFADQQLIETATAAATSALSEPEHGRAFAPTSEGHPGAGQLALSEMLQGVVPDDVLEAGNWGLADETFEHWLQRGMSMSELVEVARQEPTGDEVAVALNEAGTVFAGQRVTPHSAEINRLIAASEVNAGTASKHTPTTEPAQPQPAPGPAVDVEVEL